MGGGGDGKSWFTIQMEQNRRSEVRASEIHRRRNGNTLCRSVSPVMPLVCALERGGKLVSLFPLLRSSFFPNDKPRRRRRRRRFHRRGPRIRVVMGYG